MEIWQEIPGYRGLYEVSSLGRVRSLDRPQKNGPVRKGRILKGHVYGPYRRYSLRSGDLRTVSGHRLVLEAFRGPCPEGMECRHLNGDPLDNRLDNLAWGTREENELDKAHKRVLRGEAHWGAKLTEGQAKEIKYGALSQRKTAKLYGIRQQDVSRIRLGQRWAHV